MANKYYYANSTDGAMRSLEKNTRPTISTDLDSVRAYSWELVFKRAPLDGTIGGSLNKPLTLAAKQVNGIGMSVEDIEVNRVNDKVYYPGRPSMEELVVTFDNLQKTKIDKILYELFSVTYDARTGTLGRGGFLPGAASFSKVLKNEIDVLQLDGAGEIRNQIRLFGCYPKNITHGEYNYSTNEFHTLEMTFRYDHFVTTSDAAGEINKTI